MEKEARTPIVVDETDATLFNLVKGSLGCKTGELFKELLDYYLDNRYQDRVSDRSQAFGNMIERIRIERDATISYKSTEAAVTITKEIPA